MLIDDINNLLQDFNILNFLMILKEGLKLTYQLQIVYN